MELKLAADLKKAAISHVAESSCNTYTCQWGLFVTWCDALEVPRATQPAEDATVALYLQSVVNRAKTLAPVKAASAAIAFYQKINLFNHEPTKSPAVCIVRSAATRQFGLNNNNWKGPFEWVQVIQFAEAYGVRQHGFCHLVVVAMSVIMFGAMCGYDDASGLMWLNIRFEADGSAYEITSDMRKNSQFCQQSKVLTAAFPSDSVCPVRLLQRLRTYTGGAEDFYVFRGSNGMLVSKRPGSTVPKATEIIYDQLLRYLGIWFSGVMGISLEAFRKQFAAQFGGSGDASAAAKSNVPKEFKDIMGTGSLGMRRSAT